MSRATLSVFLLVALYLAVTILSASDEKLFYDGQVGMPQIGLSIPLVLGYIIAPPLFLYLHLQTVFLLRVLSQKVCTFENALDEAFPDSTVSPIPRGNLRAEFAELLSAFAFVQLYRKDVRTSRMAQFLIWLSMTAVPLFLLFAIDLSFLRYQSAVITWSHHIVILLDLILIVFFKREVFDRSIMSIPTNLHENSVEDTRCGHHAQSLGTLVNLIIKFIGKFAFAIFCYVTGDPTQSLYKRSVRLLTFVPAFFFLIVLLVMANPPHFPNELQFSPEKIDEQRKKIWRLTKFETSQYGITQIWGRIWAGENWIDIVPCKLLGVGCRYLTLRRSPSAAELRFDESLQLASTAVSDMSVRFGDFREARIYSLSLRKVDFRGSDFSGVAFRNVGVVDSDFSGVDFTNATFGAPFSSRRTSFSGTTFQNSDLSKARLVGADLSKSVALSQASLVGANLDRADLSELDLSNADLSMTSLRHSNLRGTSLAQANFNKAQLSGVDFSTVNTLRGASFTNANLTGVNLSGLELIDNDFRNANLTRADVTGVYFLRPDFTGATVVRVDFQDVWDLIHPIFVQTNLYGSDFSGRTLMHVDFSGADLSRVTATGANMSHVDFSGADLSRVTATGANMSHVDLSGATLDRAKLTNVDLRYADLKNATSYWADFNGGQLQNASFVGANLERANFGTADVTNVILDGANLSRADFTESEGATCSQLQTGKNWIEAKGVETLCEYKE